MGIANAAALSDPEGSRASSHTEEAAAKLPREPESEFARPTSAGTGEDHARELSILLPTSECRLLWRSKSEGGYALCVYLPEASARSILSYLARCNNPGLEVELALAVLACETPDVMVTPDMIEAGKDVLEDYYRGDAMYALNDECISRVYRHMSRVRPKLDHEALQIAGNGV